MQNSLRFIEYLFFGNIDQIYKNLVKLINTNFKFIFLTALKLSEVQILQLFKVDKNIS